MQNHQNAPWTRVPVSIKTMPYSIIFPSKENNRRARKVILRSNYKHPVKFASKKNNRLLELESLLEWKRAILLEVDCSVLAFQEQPFLLEYVDEGKVRRIYPDLLLHKKDGTKIIEEIKPAKKVEDIAIRRRFSIEEKLLAREGYYFSVQTENEIDTHHLKAIKAIYPYRRYSVPSCLREMVLFELSKRPLKACDLICKIEGLEEENLFSLVASSVVSVQHDGKIGVESIYFIEA